MEWFLKAFGDIKVATVVVVIAALYFLWKIYKIIAENFREKYEIQAEKERQMQDILAQVKQYPKWRQQSLEKQQELTKEIENLRRTQEKINKNIEQNEEKRTKQKRSELRDRLLQSYRYYTSKEKNPLQSWSEMEADAFWQMFGDYEGVNGDGHMHSTVQPEMRSLEVVSMGDEEKLSELMQSRK